MSGRNGWRKGMEGWSEKERERGCEVRESGG